MKRFRKRKCVEQRKCLNCGGESFDVTENVETGKIYLNCSDCYDSLYTFPEKDRNKLASSIDTEPNITFNGN